MTPTMTPPEPTLPFAPTLPEVLRQPASRFQLKRGPFPDKPDIWSLDILRGNAFRLAHDPARSARDYPGDGFVALSAAAAEHLDKELTMRREKPRMVLLGRHADPLQPLHAVQVEIGQVIEVLAKHGVVSWLHTRGIAMPHLWHVIDEQRAHVRVSVPLLSLDRNIQLAVEPFAPHDELRLKQLSQLRGLQIPIEVHIDPLLPGLTDTAENLLPLLRRVARLGVERVTAGYLVLRPGVKEQMQQALDLPGWAELVLSAYVDGPVLRDGPQPPAQYLSKAKRQRGYANLIALAVGQGLSLQLNSLSNPDFRPPRQPSPVNLARARSLLQTVRHSRVSAVGA